MGLETKTLEVPEVTNLEEEKVLILELCSRVHGCGYRYRYKEYLEIVEGDADVITIETSEHDCTITERISIIPKSVPVVVKVVHEDKNPEVGDYIQYYIYNGKAWRSVEVELYDP